MRLPNGYGSVYRLSGSRRRPWIARVTVGWSKDKKQLYHTVGYYATRAEALAGLAAYHENPIGNRRNATLGEIYEEWYNRREGKISKSQMDAYAAMWKRFSVHEDEPIRDLKTSHIQKVIDGIVAEGLSDSSLSKARSLAGMLFEIALNDDIIRTNYARGIELPPPRPTKRKAFTDMEIHRVAQLAERGDEGASTVLILIYTGMRGGELVRLTRFNVDVTQWVITGGIKTDAGKDRPVPVHPRIRPYVQHWYDTNGPRLIHRDGNPMSVDYYRNFVFYPALKRAGIERHLTPHTCRHTFATLLDRAGVQTKHIQDLIGHADYSTTANIYTHPRIEELRRAIEAL